MTSSKFKFRGALKGTIRKVKGKPNRIEKKLKFIYLVRNLYLNYVKNYYNSFIKRQITI